MNLYPKYFDLIGIKPTHYILLDSMEEVRSDFEVLIDCFIKEDLSKTQLWLSEYWYQRFSSQLSNCNLLKFNSWVRAENLNLKFKNSIWRIDSIVNNYYLMKHYFEVLFGGKLVTNAQVEAKWAKSFSHGLYSFRSTLVVALNLAWLLNYETVILVGVDLNDASHFHPPYSDKVTEKLIENFGKDALTKISATLWKDNIPPVQYAMKPVLHLYKKTGRNLYVANSNSLLAKEGFLPFRSICC